MSLRVVFRIAARLEFEESANWYDEQRKGLGEEFLHDIDELIFRAATRPAMYPVVFADARRVIARRFPYAVFYRIKGNTLIVLAVFHAHRDPAIWKRRV